MKKDEKISYTSRPIPTSTGASQVTYEDLKAMKGGASMDSALPKKLMIPDGTKGKKGFSGSC